MKNQALQENQKPHRKPSLVLVPAQAGRRSWLRSFLSIFSRPDFDLAEFERLETKRTPQQIRREYLHWGQ